MFTKDNIVRLKDSDKVILKKINKIGKYLYYTGIFHGNRLTTIRRISRKDAIMLLKGIDSYTYDSILKDKKRIYRKHYRSKSNLSF